MHTSHAIFQLTAFVRQQEIHIGKNMYISQLYAKYRHLSETQVAQLPLTELNTHTNTNICK